MSTLNIFVHGKIRKKILSRYIVLSGAMNKSLEEG